MLFKFFVTILSLFLISGNHTISEDWVSEKISWDENHKLSWKDFQARPQNNSTLDAYSMLGISIEVISQGDGQVELGVFGYFEKPKSWVKADEKTDRLLLHEQKHFDICEIYRRKLVKRLEAQNPFSAKTFSDEVGKVFNKVFQEYTEEQDRYDHATKHSQNKEEQAKWNLSIEKDLKALEKYSAKIAASLNKVTSVFCNLKGLAFS